MIFFVGYYGFGNVGDEAILAATVAGIRASRPDLRIVVASGNPEKTAAVHGVEAISWKDIPAIHHAVQSSRLVVLGGGGLFHDYWGVDPDTFLTERHWGAAYYAGPALLATLYRKPVMLYAVGAGPLYSEYGRKFTRLAAQAARSITVRDEASKALFEDLGVSGDRIRVTADPGFLFAPAVSAELEEAVPPEFPLRRPILGVAARHWGVAVHPDFLEREIAAALDLFIKQSGGSVVLVPFQDISGERENDRATAARILAQMRLRESAAITGEGSPDQIYEWLRGCDVIAGMRLHALIFAATAGVPAVTLSYDPKVDELTRRLGLENMALDVKDLDASVLAQRVMEALHCREQIRGSLLARSAELRVLAEENISTAVGLLDVLPAEAGLRLAGFDLVETNTTAAEHRAGEQRVAELSGRLRRLEQQNREITHKLVETEKREHALEQAKSALQASVAELRENVRAASERRDAAERGREEYANRLRDAEAERAAVVRDLDRFGAVLQNNLVMYRAQRAWKAMLLLRKGYTLFFRSKLEFLRWAAGLLIGRAGNLDEYELPFPDITAYIPETFRRAGAEAANGHRAVDAAAAAVPSPPANPPQRDRYDILILAIIDFDFRFQRPQQIAAEFARQGHRVFWISPTRFLPASSPAPYEVLPLRENLWEIHLRSRQPDIYMGDLKPEDIQAMSGALEQLYRDWTISEHSVMVQLPFWRRLALELRKQSGATLLYDCMDDWETFENMGAFNVSEEKELVKETDVLVVTGAELEGKFRAQGLEPVLARNGADYRFFSAAAPNDLLAGVAHPIVGYFGAIADWIDLDLVYEVARRRPQYSFVLIGQVFGRDVSQLEALPNVRLLGNRPYADIPGYLFNFDACVIPFLLNQVTKATDPVKLYEYFSLGKPVVATDMAELRQCGDLLYIGRDAEDFARKLDAALEEKDAELIRRRIEFAKANTWTNRVDQIDQAVRRAFPLVSILIVTHNSARFVAPCLDSLLRAASYPAFEVIVVDNASADDTVERLRQYAEQDGRVRVTALPQNLGFAGGNNEAARKSRGEYLVFLNIDTMVTSGWIGRLLRHLHRDPFIGLLCPVTNFAGNEVKINVSYTGFQEMQGFARALAAAKAAERTEIRVAPLYCAVMPRRVWEQIGEMDTRYEIGMFEDDDLSMRVRRAGYGVFAAEDCFIHHFGQGSFAKLSSEKYNRIFEANRKRFEEKWQQSWTAHRTRPGVRPAYEEKRFEPEEFVRG